MGNALEAFTGESAEDMMEYSEEHIRDQLRRGAGRSDGNLRYRGSKESSDRLVPATLTTTTTPQEWGPQIPPFLLPAAGGVGSKMDRRKRKNSEEREEDDEPDDDGHRDNFVKSYDSNDEPEDDRRCNNVDGEDGVRSLDDCDDSDDDKRYNDIEKSYDDLRSSRLVFNDDDHDDSISTDSAKSDSLDRFVDSTSTEVSASIHAKIKKKKRSKFLGNLEATDKEERGEEPAEESADEMAEEPAEEPADEQAEKPADERVENTTNEQAVEQAMENTEEWAKELAVEQAKEQKDDIADELAAEERKSCVKDEGKLKLEESHPLQKFEETSSDLKIESFFHLWQDKSSDLNKDWEQTPLSVDLTDDELSNPELLDLATNESISCEAFELEKNELDSIEGELNMKKICSDKIELTNKDAVNLINDKLKSMELVEEDEPKNDFVENELKFEVNLNLSENEVIMKDTLDWELKHDDSSEEVESDGLNVKDDKLKSQKSVSPCEYESEIKYSISMEDEVKLVVGDEETHDTDLDTKVSRKNSLNARELESKEYFPTDDVIIVQQDQKSRDDVLQSIAAKVDEQNDEMFGTCEDFAGDALCDSFYENNDTTNDTDLSFNKMNSEFHDVDNLQKKPSSHDTTEKLFKNDLNHYDDVTQTETLDDESPSDKIVLTDEVKQQEFSESSLQVAMNSTTYEYPPDNSCALENELSHSLNSIIDHGDSRLNITSTRSDILVESEVESSVAWDDGWSACGFDERGDETNESFFAVLGSNNHIQSESDCQSDSINDEANVEIDGSQFHETYANIKLAEYNTGAVSEIKLNSELNFDIDDNEGDGPNMQDAQLNHDACDNSEKCLADAGVSDSSAPAPNHFVENNIFQSDKATLKSDDSLFHNFTFENFEENTSFLEKSSTDLHESVSNFIKNNDLIITEKDVNMNSFEMSQDTMETFLSRSSFSDDDERFLQNNNPEVGGEYNRVEGDEFSVDDEGHEKLGAENFVPEPSNCKEVAEINPEHFSEKFCVDANEIEKKLLRETLEDDGRLEEVKDAVEFLLIVKSGDVEDLDSSESKVKGVKKDVSSNDDIYILSEMKESDGFLEDDWEWQEEKDFSNQPTCAKSEEGSAFYGSNEMSDLKMVFEEETQPSCPDPNFVSAGDENDEFASYEDKVREYFPEQKEQQPRYFSSDAVPVNYFEEIDCDSLINTQDFGSLGERDYKSETSNSRSSDDKLHAAITPSQENDFYEQNLIFSLEDNSEFSSCNIHVANPESGHTLPAVSAAVQDTFLFVTSTVKSYSPDENVERVVIPFDEEFQKDFDHSRLDLKENSIDEQNDKKSLDSSRDFNAGIDRINDHPQFAENISLDLQKQPPHCHEIEDTGSPESLGPVNDDPSLSLQSLSFLNHSSSEAVALPISSHSLTQPSDTHSSSEHSQPIPFPNISSEPISIPDLVSDSVGFINYQPQSHPVEYPALSLLVSELVSDPATNLALVSNPVSNPVVSSTVSPPLISPQSFQPVLDLKDIHCDFTRVNEGFFSRSPTSDIPSNSTRSLATGPATEPLHVCDNRYDAHNDFPQETLPVPSQSAFQFFDSQRPGAGALSEDGAAKFIMAGIPTSTDLVKVDGGDRPGRAKDRRDSGASAKATFGFSVEIEPWVNDVTAPHSRVSSNYPPTTDLEPEGDVGEILVAPSDADERVDADESAAAAAFECPEFADQPANVDYERSQPRGVTVADAPFPLAANFSTSTPVTTPLAPSRNFFRESVVSEEETDLVSRSASNQPSRGYEFTLESEDLATLSWANESAIHSDPRRDLTPALDRAAGFSFEAPAPWSRREGPEGRNSFSPATSAAASGAPILETRRSCDGTESPDAAGTGAIDAAGTGAIDAAVGESEESSASISCSLGDLGSTTERTEEGERTGGSECDEEVGGLLRTSTQRSPRIWKSTSDLKMGELFLNPNDIPRPHRRRRSSRKDVDVEATKPRVSGQRNDDVEERDHSLRRKVLNKAATDNWHQSVDCLTGIRPLDEDPPRDRRDRQGAASRRSASGLGTAAPRDGRRGERRGRTKKTRSKDHGSRGAVSSSSSMDEYLRYCKDYYKTYYPDWYRLYFHQFKNYLLDHYSSPPPPSASFPIAPSFAANPWSAYYAFGWPPAVSAFQPVRPRTPPKFSRPLPIFKFGGGGVLTMIDVDRSGRRGRVSILLPPRSASSLHTFPSPLRLQRPSKRQLVAFCRSKIDVLIAQQAAAAAAASETEPLPTLILPSASATTDIGRGGRSSASASEGRRRKSEEPRRRSPGKATATAKSAGEDGAVDVEGFRLLWELMELLLRQNGRILGADVAELLTGEEERALDSSSSQELVSDVSASGRDFDQPLDPTAVIRQFRRLLQVGKMSEAVDWAFANKEEGHAMYLTMMMDSVVPGANVSSALQRVEREMAPDDSLLTLYYVMTNRQPPIWSKMTDPRFADWRRHVAIAVANLADESQRRDSLIGALTLFADALQLAGKTPSSHFVRLVAFWCAASLPATPLPLLGHQTGADPPGVAAYARRGSIGARPSPPASRLSLPTDDVIQLTEIHEYLAQQFDPTAATLAEPRRDLDVSLESSDHRGLRSSSSDSKLDSLVDLHRGFAPFKLLYAQRLLEAGLARQALAYCAETAKDVARHPSLARPTRALALSALAEDKAFVNSFVANRNLEETSPVWLRDLNRFC